MPEDNIRIQIVVSPYIHGLLETWARWHGKTASAFAGQIVSSQIEENLELIEKVNSAMTAKEKANDKKLTHD